MLKIIYALCLEHVLTNVFQTLKLRIRVDIGKECFGIADGLISSNKHTVMALG